MVFVRLPHGRRTNKEVIMKIRELLALTCVLLGKTDAEDYLEKGQCSNVVAAEEEIKYLLAAYESAMETAAAVEPLVAEYSAQNVKGISYNDMPGRVTAVLSVKDNGIGSPADKQDRVFERFFRVDKSHSKEIGGTGLGLSIVKHSAAYHKATISLKSVESVGTEIEVRFPTVIK